jgi:hypothetical protein
MIFNINIYAYEDNPIKGINYINDIREKLDIRIIENNKDLEQSAQIHSKYMSINDWYSTIEESGNKYYRGRYSWDRASYYYYFNPYVTEFISNNISNMKEGIIDLINNPYSRIAFLDPLYNHIGMGNYENMYTFDLGGKSRDLTTKNKKITIYPYDNMEDVSISWINNYKIDPYRKLDKQYNNVGLPITLSYYSDKVKIKKIYPQNIILKNKDKNIEIKTEILLPQDDKYIDNSLIILPLEPLSYDTNYEVKINVDFVFKNEDFPSEKNFKDVIKFKTKAKNKLLNRAKFTEYIVKELEFDILEPEEVFTDIDMKSENCKYIYTAYKNRLVSGYGDNTFRPNNNITKEQAYTLLIRYYEQNFGEIDIKDSSKNYSHYLVSDWAIPYIKKAEKIGIITTDKKNSLKKEITESEYEKIINLYNNIYIK